MSNLSAHVRASIYQPLEQPKREIRLLHILPEDGVKSITGPKNYPPHLNSPPIKCFLEYVSLDDKPIYRALSYQWETEDDNLYEPSPSDNGPVDILLNGQLVSVTYNLWTALDHFRDMYQAFVSATDLDCEHILEAAPGAPLWIDA